MAADKYFSLSYNDSSKILTGSVLIPEVDKDESNEMFETLTADLSQYPDYQHFILDASKVKDVSSYAIGVMMKSLSLVKKTKKYNIVIMTDELLQKIMLDHPEMFDFLAVFPNMNDAIHYIEK